MHILCLSLDMLLSICEYLDLDTRLVVYDVCTRFQFILKSKYLALRSFELPLYNKRWSDVLNNSYVSGSKDYLVKLDISCLFVYKDNTDIERNVLRTELKSAMIFFTKLKDLNIGYTYLKMPDCLEICPHLPKLVKLCVNFDWPTKRVVFTDDMLLAYRQTFRHIEYLHFIGTQDLLSKTDVLMYMAEPDNPKELRLNLIAEDVTVKSYRFDGIKKYHNDIFPFKKMTLEMYGLNMGYQLPKLLSYTGMNSKFEINFKI